MAITQLLNYDEFDHDLQYNVLVCY